MDVATCVRLLTCFMAASSWLMPQPRLSQGLLVVYGGPSLVNANARYRGWSLNDVHGCGASSLSPRMIGDLAYFSVDGVTWVGPCRIIDVGGRDLMLLQVTTNGEVAEVDRNTAAALGFAHGAQGFAWFGACPPPPGEVPEVYQPPVVLTTDSSSWPVPELLRPPEPTVDCYRSERSRAEN